MNQTEHDLVRQHSVDPSNVLQVAKEIDTLWREGKSDEEIATILGMKKTKVFDFRKVFKLVIHPGFNRSHIPITEPHMIYENKGSKNINIRFDSHELEYLGLDPSKHYMWKVTFYTKKKLVIEIFEKPALNI